ncbi:MAG TPA: helix-turn-helix domain-containing protein, partial [Polyangiaceae bacterium]|nr:helix-turn-helix domain-containing protein [Polyangiaceae bacterium]
NGRPKLIVPYRNGLTANALTAARASCTQIPAHHAAGDPVLIGLWEQPTVISSTPEPTCTIGVEFHPEGLSNLFSDCLFQGASELTQRIVSLSDVLGATGRALGEHVVNACSPVAAAEIVQRFLRTRLARCPTEPPLIEAALGLLRNSGYRMEVSELERRMGYSRRYLQSLFQRRVGLPPKRLASVLAFERLYRRFSQQKSVELLRRDALELFYDQSHFIRNFRRFTGSSPSAFAELDNEFGRLFYVTR